MLVLEPTIHLQTSSGIGSSLLNDESLPDALPVIGTSSKVPGVVYAFGHQHVGWTLGGITGRVVADLARGAEPEVDVAPFSARRFDSKPWWRPFASAPQLFPQT